MKTYKAVEARSPRRRGFDQWRVPHPARRLAAQAIDLGLIAVLAALTLAMLFPFKAFSKPWWLAWALLWPFFSLSAQTFLVWWTGNTPGKNLLEIKIRSSQPDGRLSPWQVLTRAAGWWLGLFTLGAGWSTIFSRTDRRAWHDLISETVVISTRQESHPPTVFEKRVGHLWLVLISLFFMSAVGSLFLFQLRKLHLPQDKQNARQAPVPRLNLVHNSWLLFLNETISPLTEASPLEMDLFNLMRLLEIQRNPPADKSPETLKQFLTDEGTPLMKKVCFNRDGEAPCQSAQLLLDMILESKNSIDHPGALPGLQAIDAAKKLSPRDLITVLEANIKATVPQSTDAYLLRAALGEVQMRDGRFHEAAEDLQGYFGIVNELGAGGGPELPEAVKHAFNRISCRALVLGGGILNETLPLACLSWSVLADWQRGQMARSPSLANDGETIGFFWSRAQGDFSKQTLDLWKAARARFKLKDMLLNDAVDAMDLVFDKAPIVDLPLDNPFRGWVLRKLTKAKIKPATVEKRRPSSLQKLEKKKKSHKRSSKKTRPR